MGAKKNTEAETTETPTVPGMTEVGAVAQEVVAGVQAMHQRRQELLLEMGRMEIKKSNMIHELRRLENQSQALLRQEAERLGIPEGVPWQLTPDGKALTAEH